MSNKSPIRVAITGGGMAGATLMHALLKLPNIDVHIFESAANFKETGAAVGVVRNGKNALRLIGDSAVQCLERAGAVPMKAAHWYLARGPHSGEQVALLNDASGFASDNVHRAAFLKELMADFPANRMHSSKKLDTIKTSEKSVVLHFADQTTHECDILVGADGIHSRVRQIILGKEDPAAAPVPAGWWFLQLLKPYAEIQGIMGKDLVDVDNHVEYCYTGDGAFWLHNILSEGNLCQVGIVVKCDEDEARGGQWKKEVTAEELIKRFSSFPSPVDKALKEILRDTPTVTAFYMWEHPHAHTYVDGPVCMIGDAAHATTPWQASGAGISFEDVLILSRLLAHANSPPEARTALKVYDHVSRPRTQRVVDSSRGTGYISTGPCKDFDIESLEDMKANLPHRWDFIMGIDLEKHVNAALGLMDQELGY